MKKYLFPMVLLALLSGCQPTSNEVNEKEIVTISETSLKNHLVTLSSDDFQGRKPFTPGETKTVEYLKEQFESFGLKPGNGDSFFQEVPMVELTAKPSPYLTVKGKNKNLELSVLEEFVAYSERVETSVSLEDSELVFAGYGIVAPEYDWNDYEGLDVTGKTVLVLVNDPGFAGGDSTFFKGRNHDLLWQVDL